MDILPTDIDLTKALLIFVLVVIIVYLLDINYFLRVGLTLLNAGLTRKPLGVLDESVLYARVLPFDADVALIHMNNARVIREFDFGRWDLGARNGLMRYALFEKFGKIPRFLVAAQVVRYRRSLYMFMKYKITTRVVYWEGNVIYYKQEIVAVNNNIVCTTAYCKGFTSVNIDEFVERCHPGVKKPEAPEDLGIWIKFNQENSVKPSMEQRNSSRKVTANQKN